MFMLSSYCNIKSLCVLSRFYSCLARKNHYEVLNLRRNCSDKDIKEAFIQLSKEFHPDKNKDVKAKEHFIRILEAYNILGKPSSRARYDNTIEIVVETNQHAYKPHVPYNLRNNPRYHYYENRAREHNRSSRSQPFSQGAGGRQLPNYLVIVGCVLVTVLGLSMQIVVIRNSFRRKLLHENEKKKMNEDLERLKSQALMNGNEKQTRLILEKIANGSNSTVATATLGQALANERR